MTTLLTSSPYPLFRFHACIFRAHVLTQERVSRNLSDADLRRWTEEAQASERSKGVESIKAEITDIRKALKAKANSHSNIVGGFKGGEADAETRKLLGVLADDMAALRARLAEKGKELAAASRDEAAGKPRSPARMRATALKDLDAVQKRELLKTIVRRVELTPNGIVLNPFEGDPIVGEVKEREGVRSGRSLSARALNDMPKMIMGNEIR